MSSSNTGCACQNGNTPTVNHEAEMCSLSYEKLCALKAKRFPSSFSDVAIPRSATIQKLANVGLFMDQVRFLFPRSCGSSDTVALPLNAGTGEYRASGTPDLIPSIGLILDVVLPESVSAASFEVKFPQGIHSDQFPNCGNSYMPLSWQFDLRGNAARIYLVNCYGRVGEQGGVCRMANLDDGETISVVGLPVGCTVKLTRVDARSELAAEFISMILQGAA